MVQQACELGLLTAVRVHNPLWHHTVSSVKSILGLVAELDRPGSHIHVLVQNAGVLVRVAAYLLSVQAMCLELTTMATLRTTALSHAFAQAFALNMLASDRHMSIASYV